MKRGHHLQSQSHCDGCGGAGGGGCYFLRVRYRGKYQRLCTSCVLKNHQGFFCPVCFEVYDPRPPPSHARLMCLNCPSISHLSCVSPNPINAPYRCPSCLDPNFSFFNAASEPPKNQKIKVNHEDGELLADLRGFPVDKEMAKQVVAAARIALETMNKAAIMARVEAERRVKEAVLARKRANEALERLAYLVAKEKEEGRKTTGQNIRPAHVDVSVSTNIKKNSVNGLQSTGHLQHKRTSHGIGGER